MTFYHLDSQALVTVEFICLENFEVLLEVISTQYQIMLESWLAAQSGMEIQQ